MQTLQAGSDYRTCHSLSLYSVLTLWEGRCTAGFPSWTELPELTQTLAVQRLTLWDGARLACASKEFNKLYRSRQSSGQARLLRLLSTGMPGCVSSDMLMRMLLELVTDVCRPWRAQKRAREPPFMLDMQGREGPFVWNWSLVPWAVLGTIDVRTWPAAYSCDTAAHVWGHYASYRVVDMSPGVHMICCDSSDMPQDCRLCLLRQASMQQGSESGGPGGVAPVPYAPYGHHGDLVWLDIFAADGRNLEWVLATLLALVHRVASLPWVPGETADQQGSLTTGSRSCPSAPPVFIFCSAIEPDAASMWEDPSTWEPFSDACDLHIFKPGPGMDPPGYRGMCHVLDLARMLERGGMSRTLPTVLVFA